MNENDKPLRFADEEEDGDWEPEEVEPADILEIVPEEDNDFPKPAAARTGKFAGMAGMLQSMYGTGTNSRRGDRSPVMCFHDLAEPPTPFLCASCGETRIYKKEDHSGEIEGRVFFFRRPLCSCEEREKIAGELRNARELAERRRKHIDKMLGLSRLALKLPERFNRSTFDGYDTDRHSSMKAAHLAARNFAETTTLYFATKHGTATLLPEDIQALEVPDYAPAGLVMIGGTGRGKSHLAAAIGKYAARHGVIVVFENVESFLKEIPQQSETGGDRMRIAKDADLLILDDMGTEHVSAKNPTWVPSTLYGLINYRYEKELPTVITSMLTPENLTGQYGLHGPAIISRLSVCEWLKIGGPDGRSYRRESGK